MWPRAIAFRSTAGEDHEVEDRAGFLNPRLHQGGIEDAGGAFATARKSSILSGQPGGRWTPPRKFLCISREPAIELRPQIQPRTRFD